MTEQGAPPWRAVPYRLPRSDEERISWTVICSGLYQAV